MITFFENVWGFILNIVEFVSQACSSFMLFINLLINALVFPVNISNYVPVFLLTSINLVVVVGILKLIFGRGNNT